MQCVKWRSVLHARLDKDRCDIRLNMLTPRETAYITRNIQLKKKKKKKTLEMFESSVLSSSEICVSLTDNID